jgi:iron complex outermembrane receptor protein
MAGDPSPDFFLCVLPPLRCAGERRGSMMRSCSLSLLMFSAPARRRLRPLAGLSAIGLALFSAGAQAEESTEPLVLPPIRVDGQAPSGNSYRAEDAGAATKTGTTAMETPQSVRILPPQLLEDTNATRLDDTFDYVSGVARQNNFGGVWDNFAIRGFTGHEDTGPDFLRNGFAANRGFNAPRDTANVEHIEFLKGPAAALYGRSEPGGIVNIVTEPPLWTI